MAEVWLAQYNEGGYSGIDLISVHVSAEGAKRACEIRAHPRNFMDPPIPKLTWQRQDDEDEPWFGSWWSSGSWIVTKVEVLP